MGAQQLEPVPAEGVDPSVRPNVRPPAAVLAQLEVVLVGGISMLPDKHQFVLAPVKTAHSGVRLRPNAQVLELEPGAFTGIEQLRHVPPVHTDEQDGTVGQSGLQRGKGVDEELGEICPAHLAGGHREIAVADPAETGHEPGDRYVVRRVGEYRGYRAPVDNAPDQLILTSITARDRVAT